MGLSLSVGAADAVPPFRQGGDRPRWIGQPLVPWVVERRLAVQEAAHGSYAFGAKGFGLLRREDLNAYRLLQLLFVLPRPCGPVWWDQHVQAVIDEVVAAAVAAQGGLQVHVPPGEGPVGFPQRQDGVSNVRP